MCFSAEASFGASVVLAAVSVPTLRNAANPAQVSFALIPLLFSVQQAAEGVLWTALAEPGDSGARSIATYVFLIFAQTLWPFWVPFSVLRLEKDRVRKKIITIVFWIGTGIALYLLYCIFTYGAEAEVTHGHIRYSIAFPSRLVPVSGVFYLVATTMPLFISSFKGMRLLAVATLLSFIVTKIYFEEHLVSVWCFFAALISMMILWLSTNFKYNTSP